MDTFEILVRSQNLADVDPSSTMIAEVSLQSLRYACGRQMFCPATGRCLDAGRAVEISVWHKDQCLKTTAVDVDAAQGVVENLIEVARRQTPWLTVAVIDGRLFNAQGLLRRAGGNNATRQAVEKLAQTVIEHNLAAANGCQNKNKQLRLL